MRRHRDGVERLWGDVTADDTTRLLDLRPHPEGGHYRETFRDHTIVGSRRAASTAIYFLLQIGESSRWHRVDAAEVWRWHAGAPLTAGGRPQAVVPAHAWQQAQSLGAWTLIGCTVAPGFEFAGFDLAPQGFDPASRAD